MALVKKLLRILKEIFTDLHAYKPGIRILLHRKLVECTQSFNMCSLPNSFLVIWCGEMRRCKAIIDFSVSKVAHEAYALLVASTYHNILEAPGRR